MNELRIKKDLLLDLQKTSRTNNFSLLKRKINEKLEKIDNLIEKQKHKSKRIIFNEIKEKAFLYHIKGLTAKEISKLLDVSFRTVQNWQTDKKWTKKINPDNLKKKCFELKNKGFGNKEIANLLKISISTIQRYIKEVNENKKAKKMK